MQKIISYSDAVKYQPVSFFIERKAMHLNETEELFRKIKNYNGSGYLTVVRQFSCKNCFKCWWKRVRSIKQVSRCKKCNVKYDPIPINAEFGLGVFECSCSNKFTGKAQMGRQATCFKCKKACFSKYIVKKRDQIHRPIKFDTQALNYRNSFENCIINFSHPHYKKILAFSRVHESTGSTEASLTNQLNLHQRFIDDFNEFDVALSVLEITTDED